MKDIAILSERHSAVRIGGHDVVGIKNSNASVFHVLHKSLAVPDKEALIDFLVLHLKNLLKCRLISLNNVPKKSRKL